MMSFNTMTPNGPYSWRTAPLTSKRCILYIYSTNIGTEYFKHGIYSPYFSLQNAVCFIILTYLVPVLLTFYLEGVLKLKNNSCAKRLNMQMAAGVYRRVITGIDLNAGFFKGFILKKVCTASSRTNNKFVPLTNLNEPRGGAFGWGNALQVGRSRVRFPMVSLQFFIDIILPIALWSCSRLSL